MGKKDFSFTITYKDGQIESSTNYSGEDHQEALARASAAITAISSITAEIIDPQGNPQHTMAATAAAALLIIRAASEAQAPITDQIQDFIQEMT